MTRQCRTRASSNGSVRR
jgi:hypothetical protein